MSAAANPVRLRPRDAADLADVVASHRRALELVGGGSKRAIGHPVDADLLELTAFDGVRDYEPAELVLEAGAGTPLATIEATLAERGQRLAFEPPDFGRLLGVRASQTLGGVVAANLAGSRRVSAGAARDHLLGFSAVSGRAERFKAGGKVVKNVTGYDLPKLVAGSWGTLAVLTELTLRVAPVPEVERTLIVSTQSVAHAVERLTTALGSPHEVSSAAFDPDRGCLLRIEGFAASVRARADALLGLLGANDVEELTVDASRALWSDIGGAARFEEWPIVWRISVPPSDAPRVLDAIAPERYLLDWGGGLIWAAYGALDVDRVRAAVRDGHATLLKAPLAIRAGATRLFQPLPPALATLTARVKAAFDPQNRLNPGRLG